MKFVKIKLLIVVALAMLQPLYGQEWFIRDQEPDPPAAVPTFTLRPIKMVCDNSRLYTLFYLGNSANPTSGRFTIKTTDLSGNVDLTRCLNFNVGNTNVIINDFIVDPSTGKLVLVGSGGFIGVIDMGTGTMSYTIMDGSINLTSIAQYNGVNNSDFVVLGCTPANTSVNLYVLSRANILSSISTPTTIRAQKSIIATKPGGNLMTRGYGLAITSLNNIIMIGVARYDTYWNPMFFAFLFTNGSSTLSNLDIDPAGNTAMLFTPNTNQNGTIDVMDKVPGTDNVVFSYQLASPQRAGVGIINFNNINPVATTISFKSSMVNASFPRRGLNIQVAPNGSEAVVGSTAFPGGGPLTPLYRIGLSTTGGLTSFTTTESLFLPGVTVPATNPNSEAVSAFDNSSNLYGYINSYNFTARDKNNDRFFHFKAPILGTVPSCFNPQTIGLGTNFNPASYAIIVSDISNNLSNFNPVNGIPAVFDKICEGCGAKEPVMTNSVTVDLSFCPTPGIDYARFDPCAYLSAIPSPIPGYTFPTNNMYTLKSLATPPIFTEYNSDDYKAAFGGNGCNNHKLKVGSYEVRFYDKSNCTYVKILVNVTERLLVSGATKTVALEFCPTPGIDYARFDPCAYLSSTPSPIPGYTFPTDYMYTLKSLATPPLFTEYNSDDYKAAYGGNGCNNHKLKAGSYEVRFYDKSSCSFVTITINVTQKLLVSGATKTVALEFCPTPGVDYARFDPCAYLSATPSPIPGYTYPTDYMYTLKSLATPPLFTEYNSDDYKAAYGGNGCNNHKLKAGSYEVKFYDKSNCSFVTITVNVTEKLLVSGATKTVALEFCPLPGIDYARFDPCAYLSATPSPIPGYTYPTDYMYTLRSLATPPLFTEYNSDDYKAAFGGNGCNNHKLKVGSYEVNFFDKGNCSFVTITVNVTQKSLSQDGPTLQKNIVIDCNPKTIGEFDVCDYFRHLAGYTFPTNFMYTLADLGTPPQFTAYNSDEYKATAGGDGCLPVPHILLEGSYEVLFYDKDNCTYKRLSINVTREMHTVVCPLAEEYIPCDDELDLENIPSWWKGCEDCGEGQPGVTVTPWYIVSHSPLPNGPTRIHRQVINPQACKICEVDVDVYKKNFKEQLINLFNVPCSTTLDIFALMPCQLPPNTIIRDENGVILPGGRKDFCCETGQDQSYHFYAEMPDGCLCELWLKISCWPPHELVSPKQPNTMISGQSVANRTDNSISPANTSIHLIPGQTSNTISIYPNPSGGLYNISCVNPATLTYNITVYDMAGKIVYTKTGVNSSAVSQIDLSTCANGVYTACITIDNQIQYFKIIKN